MFAKGRPGATTSRKPNIQHIYCNSIVNDITIYVLYLGTELLDVVVDACFFQILLVKKVSMLKLIRIHKCTYKLFCFPLDSIIVI